MVDSTMKQLHEYIMQYDATVFSPPHNYCLTMKEYKMHPENSKL